MRTYIVILSQIPDRTCDEKFAKIIASKNFEWWRYTALNWIIATPDNISTNQINAWAVDAYGAIFICILEATINDVAGIFPTNVKPPEGQNPFLWFHKIKDPKYVPAWEREKEKEESKK